MAEASLLSRLIYSLSTGFRINTRLVHNLGEEGRGRRRRGGEKEKHLLSPDCY